MFEKYQLLSDKTYYTCLGRVSKVVGLTIESIGPEAKLNDLCKYIGIESKKNMSWQR